MSNVLKALARGGAAETDPNFKQTVLLLHGDGTNGAQNNTFLDSSTNNFTITRNGNTTQGTFSPFSLAAGEWSNYFDGTGDYLSVPHSTDLNFGSSDFTVDCAFYLTADAALNAFSTRTATLVSKRNTSGTSTGWDLGLDGNGSTTGTAIVFQYVYTGGGAFRQLIYTSTIQKNTWYNVTVTKSGNTFTMYVNGVSVQTATFSDAEVTNSTNLIIAGTLISGFLNNFPGYISNVRFIKGSAVAPPTGGYVTPLTAVTNTKLLTCQSNRFVDNSTNAFAITRNGDVRVTPFSPFAPTAAYSAGTNGGSGYFDGSSSYLSAPTNTAFAFGTGDFTVEAWIYDSGTTAAYGQIVGASTYGSANEFLLSLNGTTRALYVQLGSTGGASSTGTVLANTWNHVAIVRSGTTVTFYINGTSGGSYTDSDNVTSTIVTTIGASNNNNADSRFRGYISNLRIVKGTAVYTSNFTPPTTPLTAISNTSLLLNFTNAGIIDNTGKNNLETVGNAQIDTTTKKYGTGSLEFDGTGDSLLIPSSPDMQMGSGDFTWECWVYMNSLAANFQGIIDTGTAGARTTGALLYFGTSTLYYFSNNSNIVSSSSFPTGTWKHIAVTRSGSTVRLFVDGTQAGSSGTSSTNMTSPILYVGNTFDSFSLNGYIDDLRITKGVARYTANFTAPTKEFPDL